MKGLSAPLQNSQRVLGPVDNLARIVLHGFQGDIGQMPSMSVLDDKEIADILTYIRSAWGNDAGSVSPKTVGRIRKETEARNKPWTRKELSDYEITK